MIPSKWIYVVPYFLSAVLFLSGFFVIFSPLPLLILAFHSSQKNRGRTYLAMVTNAALVAVAGGKSSLYFYAIFILSTALSLPEFLKRKFSLEKSGALTLFAVLLVGAGFLFINFRIHHLHFTDGFQMLLNSLVDYMNQSLSPEVKNSLFEKIDPEEWKQGLWMELPSGVAIFSLILVWVNLITLLRLNPGRIREFLCLDLGYFRKWKAPEFLLWPTILCGFFIVMSIGVIPSAVALNVFKFLMAIYALQGLSILTYFFDLWGIRGLFRSIAYVLSVFIMLPLVLSIGFFDLWFDFRGKLRQS